MRSLNKMQLIGNVGAEPEFKEHDGKMVSKFSVATGEEWVDKLTNEKQTNTEWHKIVCFNKLAEIVNTYLKKGARVYISGKLKTSKWQDKNNEARSTTEIIADELIMLDGKSNGSD
jgi:single-strand DNA-binding protein